MPDLEDSKTDDKVVTEEVKAPIRDFDQLHASTIQSLDAELTEAQSKLDQEYEDGLKEEKTEKTEEVVDDKKVDKVEEEVVVEDNKPEPVVIPDAPVLDTDITKKGDGKIAVKDLEGNVFYFNNLNEVPDDFEPASSKSWGQAVQAFVDKKQEDAQSTRDREVAIKSAENQKEIDAVNANWDKEIETLTKSGAFSKDKKARDTEINETFAYMGKKLTENVTIDSFDVALKAMRYDKLQADTIIKDQEAIKLKKDQGGKVLSGGGTISGKPKSRAPLPVGMTLDKIHAHYSQTQ